MAKKDKAIGVLPVADETPEQIEVTDLPVIEPTYSCHVCGDANTKHDFNANGYDWYKCTRCGSVSALGQTGTNESIQTTADVSGLIEGKAVVFTGPFVSNRDAAAMKRQGIPEGVITIPDIAGISLAGKKLGYAFEFSEGKATLTKQ